MVAVSSSLRSKTRRVGYLSATDRFRSLKGYIDTPKGRSSTRSTFFGTRAAIHDRSSHLDPRSSFAIGHGSLSKKPFASFWRGGTSKGIFISQSQLPNFIFPFHFAHAQNRSSIRWEDHSHKLQGLLAPMLGSPDPTQRQLNGLGGGLSSLSKVVIYRLSQKDDKDADIEYTFVQVGVEDGKLDLTGNCGNLTSVVGPVTLNERLFTPASDRFDFARAVYFHTAGPLHRSGTAVPVTIHLRNTNTHKLIHSTFWATLDRNNPSKYWKYHPSGAYSIDGVPGFGSRINLRFMDPGGSKTGKVLPTGNPIDIIKTNSDSVRASLVDITNPGIFVAGSDFGWDPSKTPEELNSNNDLMSRLEALRKSGTQMMGLDPEKYKATPKIVLVYAPDTNATHIRCQALSMEKAHKAVPGTLALNLGAASKLPGTLPYELARQDGRRDVLIGHPSGTAEVGAEVEGDKVTSVELGRTARCLMEGLVNWSDDSYYETTETPVDDAGYPKSSMPHVRP